MTLHDDLWTIERQGFQDLLVSTGRQGIRDLLNWLDTETDFFIAPSSTEYHDAVSGGLLHHSLKVYDNLIALQTLFPPAGGNYDPESLKIIALLHDVCKANFYKREQKSLPRRNEKGELVLNEWGKKIWDEQIAYSIHDQFPLGHGEKSVILIQRYIPLTDQEIMAIRWHMMAFDDIRHSYAGNLAVTNASEKYRIIVLTHIADLSASFLEKAKTV